MKLRAGNGNSHATVINYGFMTAGFTRGTFFMQVAINDAGSVATVKLTGKLDIAGAEVVAMPLATLSGAKSGLVIDLSEVTFLASIGIRHLISAAKALGRRGGRLILLNPNDMVTDVLTTSGVSDFLHIARSESEALAAATAGSKAP
jgi:anti-anti-sigma factor